MTILLYHCPTAPAHRLWIAQFQNKSDLYVTVHGSSADLARAKAQLLVEYQRLDPKDRKGFDLLGRLAVLNGGEDDVEYEDLL